MIRVTSLTAMSDRQLDRLIKRVALILVIGAIAFVGFYVVDRFRMPATPMTDQRVAALEQAVRDDPTDITSRGQLADLYTSAGRFDEAIAQYTAILDAGKEVELAHFGRGTAYKANGDLDAAIADFEAVVDIAKGGEMANVDPMLEAAYYALGAIALDQARPTDAIDLLEKAIAIKRSDADALHLLAKAYVATGETAKAIDRAKAAIAFVPIGWTEPYLTLSEAYTAAGQPEMAAWASAMAEFSDGKVDDATAHLTPLAASGPAQVDAAIGLGLIAETAGDMVAAAGWYEQAIAVEPDNAAARLGLSRTREVASPAPVVSPSPMPSLPNPGDLDGGLG